jgi:PAT family beta-lactamase induction signal transducer AmpG
MAAAPRTEVAFGLGGFAYALCQGMSYSTFMAVVLLGAGRALISTRCALLISLGNLPVSYMTALDGWVHDAFGVAAMLQVEAVLALAWIGVGWVAVRWAARGPAPA